MEILRLAILLSGLSCLAANAAGLSVASLSTITTDIVKNVGGEYVSVMGIVGPNIDPHEFQPAPSDIKKISRADLVLLTGKGLEGYLAKLQETSGPATKFIVVGDAFPSLKLEEDGKEVEDPHWWHSIKNVEKATCVVHEALRKADPSHADVYEKNADAYLASLAALQKWAREEIAQLPREKRKLVTSHDAFQYFARDFGFKIYAIEGVSTDDQPSSKKVADLLRTIKEEKVKAVFFENIENPKVITAITKETGAKIGGGLYADGLGDKEAATYDAMMRHNITTIVESLK